jgi:hypothetical protein
MGTNAAIPVRAYHEAGWRAPEIPRREGGWYPLAAALLAGGAAPGEAADRVAACFAAQAHDQEALHERLRDALAPRPLLDDLVATLPDGDGAALTALVIVRRGGRARLALTRRNLEHVLSACAALSRRAPRAGRIARVLLWGALEPGELYRLAGAFPGLALTALAGEVAQRAPRPRQPSPPAAPRSSSVMATRSSPSACARRRSRARRSSASPPS